MKQFRPVVLAVLVTGPAWGAQGDDPDWPCVQRRVESLSLAVMWPYPVPDDEAPLPAEFADLAEAMALRRVSIEDIGQRMDAVMAEHPDLDADAFGRIYAAAFARMDRQRTTIIRGIVRYARGQTQLADEIDTLRSEMKALEAAAEPDFDRMDELEAEIDWRVRVFEDRNAALTYVCESPVLLESRAYEVAQQMIRRLD